MKIYEKDKKRIGEILIIKGFINKQQLDEALKMQLSRKELLGLILVKLGYVNEEDVSRSIAEIFKLPYVELDGADIESEAIRYISASLASRHNIIPIKVKNDVLQLVCDRPLSGQLIANLRRLTGKQIRVCITTNSVIKGLIKDFYVLSPAFSKRVHDEETIDRSVIDILNDLITKAIRQRASDIHFEPGKSQLRVRFRIDGVLSEDDLFSLDLAPPIISRIKILSGLDIAERRAPQDGSFVFEENEEAIDIRVSTLPSIIGEKVVLRLLPSKKRIITLDSLGMENDTFEIYKALIRRPHGIILITGPTGCGKTTTLYASLLLIRSVAVNITTIEDPVEYHIEGITQTQVNHANKISFPKALRHILRQDPDIIMVGEIRDKETADIALRAALTGHLVFSTLHTNDAPSALTRLIDMGCEPYLVSSTVSAILAQRLIRLNCESCRTKFFLTPDELQKNRAQGLPDTISWYRSQGCRRCQDTGYRGRTGIFELLEVNEAIQQEIIKCSSAERVREIAINSGMRTLRQDGFLKAQYGLTSPEEVLRVTVLD